MLDRSRPPRVAIVFRDGAPVHPDPRPSPRLLPMAAALGACGLEVVAVPYAEGHESDAARALTSVTAALVWVDPLSDDGDRHGLDQVLRDAAETGVWVSAHPDVVDRIGTKEVLVATRHLSWGSDVHLSRSVEQFHAEFPRRLAADGVRVVKASRGNGGRAVWKVRLPGGPTPVAPDPADPDQLVVVQHARIRDISTETMPLSSLMQRCADGFSAWDGQGTLVDQEFVAGIAGGIVRCYLVGGEVIGFARQYPAGAVPDGPLAVAAGTGPAGHDVMGLPSPKTMHPPDEPAFAGLRERLEQEWVPGTLQAVGLTPARLPALWDVDLIVDVTPGEPRFVLCEINASSVMPFPPEAPGRVAAYLTDRLDARYSPMGGEASGGGGGI